MPIVTDIKAQKRRSNRFSVFVDRKYTFSLGELDLVNSGLRVGSEIDEAQINELQAASQLGKLRDAGYVLLSYRPRSVREFTDHLVRKGWQDEEVGLVTEEFQAQGYLNDEQFAKDWVAYRQSTTPKSAAILRAELIKKGIDSDQIDTALSDLEGPDKVIRGLIETKRLNDRYKGDVQKMTQYLMRQGFRYSDIQLALQSGDD